MRAILLTAITLAAGGHPSSWYLRRNNALLRTVPVYPGARMYRREDDPAMTKNRVMSQLFFRFRGRVAFTPILDYFTERMRSQCKPDTRGRGKDFVTLLCRNRTMSFFVNTVDLGHTEYVLEVQYIGP